MVEKLCEDILITMTTIAIGVFLIIVGFVVNFARRKLGCRIFKKETEDKIGEQFEKVSSAVYGVANPAIEP